MQDKNIPEDEQSTNPPKKINAILRMKPWKQFGLGMIAGMLAGSLLQIEVNVQVDTEPESLEPMIVQQDSLTESSNRNFTRANLWEYYENLCSSQGVESQFDISVCAQEKMDKIQDEYDATFESALEYAKEVEEGGEPLFPSLGDLQNLHELGEEYQDAVCNFIQKEYEGGSIQSYMVSLCKFSIFENRQHWMSEFAPM
jgi:uncharacterized protein YecT (DUF1311 family)